MCFTNGADFEMLFFLRRKVNMECFMHALLRRVLKAALENNTVLAEPIEEIENYDYSRSHSPQNNLSFR